MGEFEFEDRSELLGRYMIDNRSTVRATANYFGISKSTVHKDVTERLEYINRDLYNKVKQILIKNKMERHIRGGIATKVKYKNISNIKKGT